MVPNNESRQDPSDAASGLPTCPCPQSLPLTSFEISVKRIHTRTGSPLLAVVVVIHEERNRKHDEQCHKAKEEDEHHHPAG